MREKRLQRISFRLFRRLIAKERPSTFFEQVFFDIRERARQWKENASLAAASKLADRLGKDLESKGLHAQVNLKLGKYKGSRFVTSAKIAVKANTPFKGLEDERLPKILAYLQTTYSPKFKFKGFGDSGEALFNVR